MERHLVLAAGAGMDIHPLERVGLDLLPAAGDLDPLGRHHADVALLGIAVKDRLIAAVRRTVDADVGGAPHVDRLPAARKDRLAEVGGERFVRLRVVVDLDEIVVSGRGVDTDARKAEQPPGAAAAVELGDLRLDHHLVAAAGRIVEGRDIAAARRGVSVDPLEGICPDSIIIPEHFPPTRAGGESLASLGRVVQVGRVLAARLGICPDIQDRTYRVVEAVAREAHHRAASREDIIAVAVAEPGAVVPPAAVNGNRFHPAQGNQAGTTDQRSPPGAEFDLLGVPAADQPRRVAALPSMETHADRRGAILCHLAIERHPPGSFLLPWREREGVVAGRS